MVGQEPSVKFRNSVCTFPNGRHSILLSLYWGDRDRKAPLCKFSPPPYILRYERDHLAVTFHRLCCGPPCRPSKSTNRCAPQSYRAGVFTNETGPYVFPNLPPHLLFRLSFLYIEWCRHGCICSVCAMMCFFVALKNGNIYSYYLNKDKYSSAPRLRRHISSKVTYHQWIDRFHGRDQCSGKERFHRWIKFQSINWIVLLQYWLCWKRNYPCSIQYHPLQ